MENHTMTHKKRAFITGITGQDGSYLADLLLSKGYDVIGFERRTSQVGHENIAHLKEKITIISGDLLDQGSLSRAISEAEPDEFYNLGAQSFVGASWDQPEYTCNVTGLGAIRALEAVRAVNKRIKFYQASSSEMFGNAAEIPQRETTVFRPRSPYGIAKLSAHWAAVNYRESHGIFAVSGILFNHESPRRGMEFVSRKITHAAARIKLGLGGNLELGTIEARRDWGFAGDYVEAMWRMLQQPEPKDYVVASGVAHTVRDWLEIAFDHVGLNWSDHVVYNHPKYLRPAEVHHLLGDASRARRELGWNHSVSFKELVHMMVDADLERLEKR